MSTACDHRVYVRHKDDGDLRVGEADLSLESVVVAWSEELSPESIRSQYPSLKLDEVYGAIAWILAHPAEVEAYMKRQTENWAKFRAWSESRPDALRDRLRSEIAKRNLSKAS